MINLIYKDILLQKKTILFAFGYGVFLLVALNNNEFSNFIYYMGTIAIAHMMFMTAASLDDRNKSDKVLISLPIKRSSIILEKYVLIFLTVFIGITLMGFLGGVIKISGLVSISRFVNINDLFLSLASVLFFNSFYYPLYLKLGHRYSQVINIFAFLILFFLPSWIAEFIAGSDSDILVKKIIAIFSTTPTIVISLSVLVITLILSLLSYLISVRIYINKEF